MEAGNINFSQFDYSASINVLANFTDPKCQEIVLRDNAISVVSIDDHNNIRPESELQVALVKVVQEANIRIRVEIWDKVAALQAKNNDKEGARETLIYGTDMARQDITLIKANEAFIHIFYPIQSLINIAKTHVEIGLIEDALATLEPIGVKEFDDSLARLGALLNIVKNHLESGNLAKAKEVENLIEIEKLRVNVDEFPIVLAIKFLALLEIAIAEKSQMRQQMILPG